MSDSDKRRIDELEEKLLAMHEKLQEASEAKSLAEKAKEVAEAKNKTNWFSKEMIAVYMAIIGGATAWGENLITRLSEAAEKQQAQVQEKKVNTKVGEGIVKYVDYRIGEVSDICQLYLDAVLEAMPSYQRRKVEKFISENEGEEPTAASVSVMGVGVSPNLPTSATDSVVEHIEDMEGSVAANVGAAPPSHKVETPFQAILEQAQSGEEIDFKEILKKSKSPLKKR